jgi:hypothetical protein
MKAMQQKMDTNQKEIRAGQEERKVDIESGQAEMKSTVSAIQ